MKELTVKVPGKLMVAGEFAVLEPYQKLIVMAVDRFVYATIEDGDENLLTLENFGLHHLRWKNDNDSVLVDSQDKRVNFVEQAIEVVSVYLREQSIPMTPISLKINSELDEEGVKYGLGSSAAVVTAVITAILEKYLPDRPSRQLIFKLAAISHVKTQGNGSGADIAASTYGGFLQYSSFQADWLLDELSRTSRLTSLVKKDWKYLTIKKVEFPQNLSVCVGWTGQPASTAKLVDEILVLKEEKPAQFQQFLMDSQQAVEEILNGVTNASILDLLEGIRKNRYCLATIGEIADVKIETDLLAELAELAERFEGAGKLSGAGGGDCGIAFIPSAEQAVELLKTWESVGIQPLSIQPYSKGAHLI